MTWYTHTFSSGSDYNFSIFSAPLESAIFVVFLVDVRLAGNDDVLGSKQNDIKAIFKLQNTDIKLSLGAN